MLGHTSVSRQRGREFSAASCSFRSTTVVLGSEQKILFYFGHLPIILQQKQQLVIFFRETEKIFCKVTSSEWVYEFKKAKAYLQSCRNIQPSKVMWCFLQSCGMPNLVITIKHEDTSWIIHCNANKLFTSSS